MTYVLGAISFFPLKFKLKGAFWANYIYIQFRHILELAINTLLSEVCGFLVKCRQIDRVTTGDGNCAFFPVGVGVYGNGMESIEPVWRRGR